jgi:hypothetical protein
LYFLFLEATLIYGLYADDTDKIVVIPSVARNLPRMRDLTPHIRARSFSSLRMTKARTLKIKYRQKVRLNKPDLFFELITILLRETQDFLI